MEASRVSRCVNRGSQLGGAHVAEQSRVPLRQKEAKFDLGDELDGANVKRNEARCGRLKIIHGGSDRGAGRLRAQQSLEF